MLSTCSPIQQKTSKHREASYQDLQETPLQEHTSFTSTLAEAHSQIPGIRAAREEEPKNLSQQPSSLLDQKGLGKPRLQASTFPCNYSHGNEVST